jgi:hypothetical protein
MSHAVFELFSDLPPTTFANESKEGESCTIATTTTSILHLDWRMTQNQEGDNDEIMHMFAALEEGDNDEIMHMFAASVVYIRMSPWP